MRQPLTLILMLPILLLCYILLGDNWFYGFGVIVTLGFLLEVKIKKREVSWKSLLEFFNTPINAQGETEEQRLARNNLTYKFSLTGLLVCLIWILVTPYYGIQIYAEYKNWSFPIGIEAVLLTLYFTILGILYRLFFIKAKQGSPSH